MEQGIFVEIACYCNCKKLVVALSEFKYLYFKIGFGVKRGLAKGGAPSMHSISNQSFVGHALASWEEACAREEP